MLPKLYIYTMKPLYLYIQSLSLSDSLWPQGLKPTRLLCPWDSPGKNTGIDCHFLLQGIFPTWRLNLGFLYCRQDLYHLNQLKEFFFIRLWKSNWDFRPWNLNITRLKHIFINQNKNHHHIIHCKEMWDSYIELWLNYKYVLLISLVNNVPTLQWTQAGHLRTIPCASLWVCVDYLIHLQASLLLSRLSRVRLCPTP